MNFFQKSEQVFLMNMTNEEQETDFKSSEANGDPGAKLQDIYYFLGKTI